MATAEPQTSAAPCHHPSAAASPRRSVGVGCEDGALAERRRRPEPHPRAQHPGTSRYQKNRGNDHPNLTSTRLPNGLIPNHRDPTPASASGGRSLQCGSRRRYRYPEPNRLCDLACAAGGSVSAHSEASTEMVPQRRPASCSPLPASEAKRSERASERARGEVRSGV